MPAVQPISTIGAAGGAGSTAMPVAMPGALPAPNKGAGTPLAPGVPGTPAGGTAPPVYTPNYTSPGQMITPTGISQGLNTQDGSHTLTGDFKDTYGAGTGTALAGVLGNLGTATDGAVKATNAAIQADAMKSSANIASGEAASGVTANSSTAALAQGDFWAGVNQNIASVDANMQLTEENQLIGALQNEGTAHGSDVSTFDSVMAGINGGLGAAVGVAELAAGMPQGISAITQGFKGMGGAASGDSIGATNGNSYMDLGTD